MPEMWPVYERLCHLANADVEVARFLTGYQPPAYVSACSQAVMTAGRVQLVRNYDYYLDLIEGSQLLTAWNGTKVIGMSDSLSGLVDGMNEHGLAISLTFGGRRVVGVGFGIPFILRYILEFCTTVSQAVQVLIRVPSHMSYNVTVLDKYGSFKTVQVAPDRPAFVTDVPYTTNHQGIIDWPENAFFNKTLERADFLANMFAKNDHDPDQFIGAFLQPPLYNTRFSEGFGTRYTAVYCPLEGCVQLFWPNQNVKQYFNHFQEQDRQIHFNQASLPKGKMRLIIWGKNTY
jgi:predicted choloylglycine hydrolase